MTDYLEWRDRLALANDQRFHPVAYQDALIASGQAQFWATETGAIITELKQYPGGAFTCETFAAAGDIETMLEAIKPAIEQFARERGCTVCMITAGREGWRRKHPDYRHYQTMLMKDLP